jgi:hypothetical protein
MPSFMPFCLLVCLAGMTFAQTSSAPSPLQLVYVADGSTLTTYNVDPGTLQATEVGTMNLPESVYPYIVPSPNGHILYYSAYRNYDQQDEMLYVYKTNSSGLPNSQPIQTLNAKGLFSYLVDSMGKFFYLVYRGAAGLEYTPYTVVRFLIDPRTGKLSQPVIEAKYKLDSGTGGSAACWLSVFGVNAAGTKLYDEISCGYHGGASATFYERTVDPNTGSLGPDQQVYSWNNSYGGGEQVYFVRNLVFDFVIPNDWQQNVNILNVYLLQPNVTNPLIQCTFSMLPVCGSGGGTTHPSAEYVFMFDFLGGEQVTTEIERVDLSSKQIVATGSTIPYEVRQFSPDGSIAYAANDVNTPLNIEIYGFNVANAQVTSGGSISVPSDLDSWFAVERR